MKENVRKAWEVAGVVVVLAVALCGCSHNVGTGFQGKLINLGYDPETNKVGIQYYDGVLVTGISRENSESTMTYKSATGGENGVNASGTTTHELTYTSKIGHQITGYFVDAVEAGASVSELKEYADGK